MVKRDIYTMSKKRPLFKFKKVRQEEEIQKLKDLLCSLVDAVTEDYIQGSKSNKDDPAVTLGAREVILTMSNGEAYITIKRPKVYENFVDGTLEITSSTFRNHIELGKTKAIKIQDEGQ